MNSKQLPTLGDKSFEAIKQTNEHGAEYWSARDLQLLLGYGQWRRFEQPHEALAIFAGPHSYISPTWYTDAGVPTWNWTPTAESTAKSAAVGGRCAGERDRHRIHEVAQR